MRRLLAVLGLLVLALPAFAQTTSLDSGTKKQAAVRQFGPSLSTRLSTRALAGETWDDRFGTLGVDLMAMAFAEIGSDVYVGGTFINAGSVASKGIARWDGKAWHAVGGGVSNTVSALAVRGTDLFVGGNFATAGGVTANHIARWDGTNWHDLAGGLDGVVTSIVVDGNKVYVGGNFTKAGGVSARNIAVWDGTKWAALGSGVDAPVRSLAVLGTDLYVGGDFRNAGGTEAVGIARWNGSAWSSVGGGVFYDSYGTGAIVDVLHVHENALYVGGDISKAGQTVVKNIARWDGTSWSDVGGGTNGRVYGLATYNGELFATGNFLKAGGKDALYIARWDGSTWSPLESGLSSTGYAAEGTTQGLFVGGSFSKAGEKPSVGIALWGSGGTSTPVIPAPPEGILRYFDPAKAPSSWGSGDWGFIFGTNKYGDQAKATVFTLPNGMTQSALQSVKVYFSYKDASLNSSKYRISIYNGTAETGPTGTAIYSQEYSFADVQADADYNTPAMATVHTFSQPVVVGSTFFVAVEYPEVANTVLTFSVGATDYMGRRVTEVWEKNEAGNWNNVSDMWTGDTGMPGNDGWYMYVEAAIGDVPGEGLVVTPNQIDAASFPNIGLVATITDDTGIPLTGLSADLFSIREDGVQQTVSLVQPIDVSESGLSTVLVIDHSVSMIDTRLDAAKTAAKLFIEMMGPQDRAAVIGYSTNVTIEQDFTVDQDLLRQAVNRLYAEYLTSTYDAIVKGVNLALTENRRRAVIIMTDGEDNDSDYTAEMATRAAVEAGVPVYIIALDYAANAKLQNLAVQSGGRYYAVPSGDQLADLYRMLSQQLKSQYLLTYTTSNPAQDGTVRNVQLTVKRGTLLKSGTLTYVAPRSESAGGAPASWECKAGTGASAAVAIPTGINPFPNGGALKTGDAIGVFYADGIDTFCAGQVTWYEGQPGIVYAWADDPETPAKDGFVDGDEIQFRLWSASAREEYIVSATISGGEKVQFYQNAAILVSALNGATSTAAEQEGGRPAAAFKVYQNYPNPFSDETTIAFDLPEVSPVRLRVFNALGAEVAILAESQFAAGHHEIHWRPVGLASGIYFFRLEAGKLNETRRMAIVH